MINYQLARKLKQVIDACIWGILLLMVDKFFTEKKKLIFYTSSCSIIIFVIFEQVAFHGDLEEQINEIFYRRKEVHACWGPKQRLCSIKLISKAFTIPENQ